MPWKHHELGGTEEVIAAAIQAREWGFPRKITPGEIYDGYWFGLGDHVIWWLEDLPSFPDEQVVHIAVDPAVRKRWPVREWLRRLEQVAIENGTGWIRALVPDQRNADYLERVGFRRDPICGHIWEVKAGFRGCRRS